MRENTYISSIKFTRRAGLLLLIASVHFLLFFHLVFKQAKVLHLAEVNTIQFTILRPELNREIQNPRSNTNTIKPKKPNRLPIHQLSIKQGHTSSDISTNIDAASLATAKSELASAPDDASTHPKFDLDQLRAQVLKNERMRYKTPEEIFREKQIVVSNVTTTFDQGAKQAEKKDCRTAYAGVGLLAIIPLVVSAATDTGCKW